MNGFVLSYTAYNDFKQCPLRFYHKHIVRDYPFEESDALVWGRAVHAAFKGRLNRPPEPFPLNMQNFEPIAADILRFPRVLSEVGFAMARNGNPVPWNARPALMKSRPDIVVFNEDRTIAYLLDIKTGNSRYEDPTELQFQAIALKAHYPSLHLISGQYFWTKEGKTKGIFNLTENSLKTIDEIKRTVDAIEALTLCVDKRDAFKATPHTPLPCDYCACPGCRFAKAR